MFQMPESLESLTVNQISELLNAAVEEATALNAIAADELSEEDAANLIALAGHINTLSTLRDDAEAKAKADAEALAAAREALSALTPKAPEANAGEQPEAGHFAVKLSGTTEGGSIDGLQEPEATAALSIIAAANVPGITAGAPLSSIGELTSAFNATLKGYGTGQVKARGVKRGGNYGGQTLSANAKRTGVARLQKAANEFTITEKMSAEDQYDLLKRAASEKRLGGGSLVAAGGWCAPSEQMYGFLELESTDGLLSLPEINVRRGGIQFNKGPQLAALLTDADSGWNYTEAQIEAGVTKPILDVECDDWSEVRLDAVGYALRAGLLTQSAYPELISRHLALGLVLHARRVNKLTIQKITTLAGSAVNFSSVGAQPSASADFLAALELAAVRVREQHSMPLDANVEAILPVWAPMVIRADLSRRVGADTLISISDAQIVQMLNDRKIAPQFVRDYQAINNGVLTAEGGTAAWTAMPTAIEATLYPAGAYARLATDVIDLDAVYDHDTLSGNEYVAAFYEEGFGVANLGGTGVRIKVALPNLFGSTGYPGIGALANVAPSS